MFYCLTGKLIHMEPNTAVISCGGVGFKCFTSANTLQCLAMGEETTLYTHLSVREDAMDLYGFYGQMELHSFKQLTSVSGVGPKAALAILSDMSPDQLAMCIASGDSKRLTRAPGVGPKIAQRVVLELKDKITAEDFGQDIAAIAAQTNAGASTNIGEAIAALVALGYNQSDAAKAVSGNPADTPVDALIKQALKLLAGL